VLRARDNAASLTDYGAVFDKFDAKPKDDILNTTEMNLVAVELGLDALLFIEKGADAMDIGVSRDAFVATCKRLLGDGPREVVLKLMQDETQWKREKLARSDLNLSTRFVVQTLDGPSDESVVAAVESMHGELRRLKDAYLPGLTVGKRMLVMDAADRNLFQIYQQERPDINMVRILVQQVAEALAHMHEKKFMHGDIKLLNVVRFRLDGRLRLIDFDAGAPISVEDPSYAGAKFSSAVLPPELFYKLKDEAERQALQSYWGSSEMELQAKVAPLKAGGRSFVVRSFRTDALDAPIMEGLPYELVEASEKIDCWALGALAYMLGAGEPLVSSTRDDDCASGGAMALLHDWGTKVAHVLSRLEKVADPALRDLISKLLHRDPKDRLPVEKALDHVFFRTGRDGGAVAPQKEVLDALVMIQEEQLKHKAVLSAVDARTLLIEQLSGTSLRELQRNREVMLKAIFEATEVQTPTTFIVLRERLPSKKEQRVQKRKLGLLLKADGSGFKLDGQLIDAVKEAQERFEESKTWVDRVCRFGSAVVKADVNAAFTTIQESLGDLVTSEKMYLYLIDELTGMPVCGEPDEEEGDDSSEEDDNAPGEDAMEEGESEVDQAQEQAAGRKGTVATQS